jgi:hypothetical protein
MKILFPYLGPSVILYYDLQLQRRVRQKIAFSKQIGEGNWMYICMCCMCNTLGILNIIGSITHKRMFVLPTQIRLDITNSTLLEMMYKLYRIQIRMHIHTYESMDWIGCNELDIIYKFKILQEYCAWKYIALYVMICAY